jgi:hypothetical protein
MGRSENFKQYAADCVRQAESQQSPDDRAILLNVALAWVRLAQQSQAVTATAVDKTEQSSQSTPPAKPAAPPQTVNGP